MTLGVDVAPPTGKEDMTVTHVDLTGLSHLAAVALLLALWATELICALRLARGRARHAAERVGSSGNGRPPARRGAGRTFAVGRRG